MEISGNNFGCGIGTVVLIYVEGIEIKADFVADLIYIIGFGRCDNAKAFSVGKTDIAVVDVAHKGFVIENAMKFSAFAAKMNAFGADRNNNVAGEFAAVIKGLVGILDGDFSVFGSCVNEVDFADESRNELGCGIAVNLHGVADLLDNTVIDNEDFI